NPIPPNPQNLFFIVPSFFIFFLVPSYIRRYSSVASHIFVGRDSRRFSFTLWCNFLWRRRKSYFLAMGDYLLAKGLAIRIAWGKYGIRIHLGFAIHLGTG